MGSTGNVIAGLVCPGLIELAANPEFQSRWIAKPRHNQLHARHHLRNGTLTAAILVLTLLTVSEAQSHPSGLEKVARKDAKAIATLALATAKMGGGLPIASSMLQAETTFSDGRVTTVSIKTLGRDHIRTEGFINGKQESSVVKKGRGKKSSDGKEERLPPWLSKYLTADHIPSLSRLADFSDAGFNFEYVALENVRNRLAHHIRSTAVPKNKHEERFEQAISQVDLFIDAESFLLLKTEKWIFSPHAIQNRSKAEVFYEDYRAVDGVLIPHRQLWAVSGQPFAVLILSSVQLNLPLSTADFD